MCVLAIAWRIHPRWKLVVAANRDEFHDRPADALHRWEGEDIIAGRDIKAGGTWLAVSGKGRFAAVTNVRGYGDPDPALSSRGALVTGLAVGTIPALDRLSGFNPFNAVLVDNDDARFLSNRPAPVSRPLAPGLHAMSNGPLDPPWRKTIRLSNAIERWLADATHDREALFAGLRDTSPPSGDPDDPAPIFVESPVYGTRCSTIVLVDASDKGMIVERRFDRDGRAVGDTAISFDWG
ncbi:MAG: NRDE family protein [Candidatus Sphingomonas colombiensis]|nr:NRDE family protein [Sphingomonas sp.]WEK42092.1 MAG: NRDE family protein [Sphingomonas sp.]